MDKPTLIAEIDQAWQLLQAFIAPLDHTALTTPRDAAGWSVLDHLSHLASWEETIVNLFDGKTRAQTVGMPVNGDDFDAENELLRARDSHLTPQQALERLDLVHQRMLLVLSTLSDQTLSARAIDALPQADISQKALLWQVIAGDTYEHIHEHLPWMQAILNQSA